MAILSRNHYRALGCLHGNTLNKVTRGTISVQVYCLPIRYQHPRNLRHHQEHYQHREAKAGKNTLPPHANPGS